MDSNRYWSRFYLHLFTIDGRKHKHHVMTYKSSRQYLAPKTLALKLEKTLALEHEKQRFY